MMAKQGASAVVPRLRFPEFRATKGWEEVKLGAIATILKGKGIAKSDVVADGAQPCIRYGELYTRYGEVIDTVYSRTNASPSDLFMSHRNDVIIPASGETKLDIAKASCVIHDGVALGGDLNVLRTDQNGVFLSYFLNGSKRFEVAKVAQGDAVVHLYPSQLQEIFVAAPKPAEQQKIADCLTSLDEVIAAQGRKVEALKAHKRGLMQQLFPREGETFPRLRFPEFRDAAEWETATTYTLTSTVTPPQKIPTSDYRAEGLLPIVDQSPDPICGWTDDLNASIDTPLPLIIFGDHTCVLKLVEHAFAQGADGIKIISALPHIDVRFLYYSLQVDPITSTAYRRHFSLLQEKRVAFPEEFAEQRRIADCLSTLDDQIAAESHQLAALKIHKQGLMQQLFPAEPNHDGDPAS